MNLSDNSQWDYSEGGTAERLKAVFGKEIRYIKDEKCWAVYNTGLWYVEEEQFFVHDKIKIIAAAIKQEAKDLLKTITDKMSDKQKEHITARAQEIMSYAGRMSNLVHMKHAVDLAKSGLLCCYDDFNKSGNLIGLQGGKVLDLQTMTVRDGKPEDMITRCLGGIPNIDADGNFVMSDEFRTYIKVFIPDASVREYLRMYLGGALCGRLLRSASDKCFMMIKNLGGTGKSTFLTALRAAFGDGKNGKNGYCVDSKMGILTGKNADGNSPDALIAALRGGVRLAIISEVDVNAELNVAQCCKITGGDRLPYRLPHGRKELSFDADFKVVVVGNRLPTVDKSDNEAFRSRLRIINRRERFAVEDTDTEMKTKMETNDNLINDMVTWIVEGTKMYLDKKGNIDDFNGTNADTCNLPFDMKVAFKQYVDENDDIAEFFTSFYTLSENASDFVTLHAITQNWRNYTGENNTTTIKFNKILKPYLERLKDAGYKDIYETRRYSVICVKKGKDDKYYRGNYLGVCGIQLADKMVGLDDDATIPKSAYKGDFPVKKRGYYDPDYTKTQKKSAM